MDEARLQEMWDHHEIRKLLATYVRGCDRADEFMMASVYCQDSWDDHGADKMDGKKFALATVKESLRTTTLVSHQLGQSYISLDGDRAGAETYFIASLTYPDDSPLSGTLCQLGGRYVDELQRVDGNWQIKKRLCVREWSITHKIERDFLTGNPFIQADRGDADVSYAVLGEPHDGEIIKGKAIA